MHRAVIILGYAVIAATMLGIGVYRPGITGYGRAMLEDMVYGEAYRPFVKRQLAPMTVRVITAATPSGVRAAVTEWAGRSAMWGRLGWPAKYATEFMVACGLMYISLIGFMAAMRAFLGLFWPLGEWGGHGAAWVTGLSLVATFCGKVYVYDFPQLFLFTAAMVLMFQKRWRMFYAVYFLCCLNKETAILAGLVYLCYVGRGIVEKRKLMHFGLMMMIGLGTAGVMSLIYRGNPGGEAEWHLTRNVTGAFSSLGWARLAIFAIGVIGCVWALGESPRFLQAGFLGVLPVLVVMTLFFGYIDELRDYYEALPFMAGLLAGIWVRRRGAGTARLTA